MNIKTTLAVLSAVLVAAPMSAQIRPRTDQRRGNDGSIIRNDGTILRPDGSVVRTSDGTVYRGSRKIPPGQLPPRGMCRVWIDGVPPGQQPPVTDCATAERNRVPNSRVIYGDRESFPGRGVGRSRSRDNAECTFRDAVVVGGRVVNVCRDANGNVIDTRRDRSGRVRGHDREDDDDDRFDHDRDDDDDDRFDHDRRKFEKREDREWKRDRKEAAKAARKQEKHNRGRSGRDD